MRRDSKRPKYGFQELLSLTQEGEVWNGKIFKKRKEGIALSDGINGI